VVNQLRWGEALWNWRFIHLAMLGNFARLQGVRKKPASEVTDAGFNPYALVSAEDSPAHQGQEETTGGKQKKH
jgi:hypothetical protein